MGVSAEVFAIKAKLRSGEEVSIPSWIVDSGKAGPVLLLIAAQHGNEVHGSEAIRRFVELAKKDMICGKVFAVPFANPPALRQRRPHIRMGPEQPYGDARGHNMNVTWPGKRSGNATARLSYAIYKAFGDEATHVLDLHCWCGQANAAAVLIRDIPELRDLARKLGHRFVHVSPPSDKTLGGYLCATGRVGVTYEFAGQYLINEAELQMGMRIVINMARAIGLLGGKLIKGEDPILFSDAMESVAVKAPCSGLFVTEDHKLYAPVEEGAVLGHILSDVDLKCVSIVAPKSGYLSAFGAYRPNCDVSLAAQHPYAGEGDMLAKISWPKDA